LGHHGAVLDEPMWGGMITRGVPMRNGSAVLLGVSLVLGAFNADAREPSEKDRHAVLEARARLIHAMEIDDFEALFAVLTGDHVTMPPDGPSMSDSKELRAWHEQRISAYAISGNWASEDLQLQGDWAIDSWRGLTSDSQGARAVQR